MPDIKAISSAGTFRMETSVSASINATPAKIMTLLTNAGSFTQWNSTIISLEGEIRQGRTIRLVSALDPKRTFKLKVTELTPQTLVFKDGFAPMFSGLRTFSLTPGENNSTNFSMVEVFKGIMLPMIKSSLPDFKSNFEQYAADLKRAAEAA